MPEIYQSAEDSFLMSRVLQQEIPKFLTKKPDLKFLEIGAGSGIHLQTAFNLGIKKQNIFSCDINPKSVEHCKLLGFNCIASDLFENIREKFDLIIFNPPYLPENKFDKQPDTSGGKKGNEIINRFLSQAKNYLNKDGRIFLITSSLSGQVDFEKHNYKFREIGCEKLFYENLCIWELSKIK